MTEVKLPQSISWTADSHRQYTRSFGWYLGFILISAALIAFEIFIDHNLITLIMFILLIVSVFLYSLQKPVPVAYKLTKLGIHSNHEFYPYAVIKNFWIIYHPPQTKTVNFKTTAYLNNNLSWNLGNQDPTLIKLFLAEHISEDLDQQERFSETLARTLKI